MGSNTIKLKLWSVDSDRVVCLVGRQRYPVRLGRGTFSGGRLTKGLIDAAVTTMQEIRARADEAGAMEIRAVGTAALREAANADDLLARISAETGIAVEVVSPHREGQLTAEGALLGLALGSGQTVVVLDIGGGSAEVIRADIGEGARISRVQPTGFPLGAVRLTEAHLRSDPPTHEEIRRLSETVRGLLARSDLRPHRGTTIGCGGTLVTVQRMASQAGNRSDQATTKGLPHLCVQALGRLRSELQSLTIEERVERFGLERQRAEVIVAGAVVLEEIASTLGAQEIAVTVHGLREGLLLEHLRERVT